MHFWISFVVSLISGLYTSLWGAFKDSPYEGLKRRTFPRSVYFHAVIFSALYWLPLFHGSFRQLSLFQVFFAIMGLERFLAELYKGFFRSEDQSKYAVPSRITFFGRSVASEPLRLFAGVVLVSGVFSLLFLSVRIEDFTEFAAVAFSTGLLVSLGGAYKDAPFEGFAPLKFFRSATVLAICTPLFFFSNNPLSPVPLGYLIFLNGGLERFLVEYYKTYVQRTMSGKFRPDLPRITRYIETREKYHYMAWIIIVGLMILYIYELTVL
jgi:hypothetical protein